MTKRFEKVRGCEWKHKFATRELALVQARYVFQRYRSVQEPYKCPHCGLWHLRRASEKGGK